MKRCTCCGAGYTAESWRGLPLLGLQDLGDGELGEMRNCRCGSTLCIEVPSPTLLADLSHVFASEAAEASVESERVYLRKTADVIGERAARVHASATASTMPPRAA